MEQKIGAVTIAPQVLATVAAHAALAVPGVARLSAHQPVKMERWLRPTAVDQGVAVVVEDGHAAIDLYLVYDRTVSMLDTSRLVQAEVARAIQETVGMNVREINVHVEDVTADSAHQP